MPCWFYDKKELRVTPSTLNGLDPNTEARYRREGARFIIDAGTKLGLRYDTYSTGVIYFHRFYMFHTFTEFHRHIIGASCLFLAGKVEETPKKCKDVVKICRSLLTDQQFTVFKENPREEIMTYERVLLQTLKFDLQVEHPYTHIVSMAKLINGDKHQLQKVVQMAWTFINDSLCTTLCLQWEAEIIAASMLYLSTRLKKFEVTDWTGREPGGKGKWWEALVDGLTQELIEDICHQVLDLYSSSKKDQASPPINSVPTPNSDSSEGPTPKKQPKPQQQESSHSTPETAPKPSSYPVPATYSGPNYPSFNQDSLNTGSAKPSAHFITNNPYVSSQMYSSSFMSSEGSQNIQSLVHQDDNRQPTYAQTAAIANYNKGYHHNDPAKTMAPQSRAHAASVSHAPPHTLPPHHGAPHPGQQHHIPGPVPHPSQHHIPGPVPHPSQHPAPVPHPSQQHAPVPHPSHRAPQPYPNQPYPYNRDPGYANFGPGPGPSGYDSPVRGPGPGYQPPGGYPPPGGHPPPGGPFHPLNNHPDTLPPVRITGRR